MKSKKWGNKVPTGGVPLNNTYIEYCAMEILSGKNILMI
jgi:hypothetical protein